MRGSFFGLNLSMSGLYSSQRALDVVNHNLANVNTVGYSRQQSIQSASKPISVYDGTGMIGTGTDVIATKRVRDLYMDKKFWLENMIDGEWEAKRSTLDELELRLAEPSDNGFNQIMEEFFSAFQELSKDPQAGAVRAVIKENGVALTRYFNNLAFGLENVQKDLDDKITIKVEEINSIASQISKLNRQIFASEIDGSNANDLRDQRGVLIDRLSKIVNIDAQEEVVSTLPTGEKEIHMVIRLGGKPLIDHYNVSKMILTQRTTLVNPDEDIVGLNDINWDDGNQMKIKSGELRGLLDMRDGNDTLNGTPKYNGVPVYIRKLNQFARTFAMAFNEGYVDVDNDGVIIAGEDGTGHVDGYGSGAPPQGTDIRFFGAGLVANSMVTSQSSTTFINGAAGYAAIQAQYNQITAKNFSLTTDILDNVSNIASADQPNQPANNKLAINLIGLRHDNTVFAEGAPEDFLQSIVSTMGVDSQQAQRFEKTQKTITGLIDNRRLSESGVSIDEEMANLVKFQQAYSASAKMIQTMAELYDILMSKVGNA